MSKVNEFDAMFGNTPDVTATPTAPAAKVQATPRTKWTGTQLSPATLKLWESRAEQGDTAAADMLRAYRDAYGAASETIPSEDKNEFEGLFSPEGHAAPSNGLSATDVAALSGAAGAAYGAVKAKPGSDNIISRAAERMYGAPKGSLAEMQGLREPALPPTAGQAAQAVAARYSGPFEVGAQTNTRLPAGSTGTMPFNYAKSAGLTDIEAGLARDMTKQPGGTHDLTTRRRIALEQLNRTNPTFVENPSYGGIMLDTSAGGGPRGAPRAAIPVAPAPVTAPLTDVAKNIERANMASRGAQRGAAAVRGGVGSGLTALQAYGMSEDMSRGRTPEWQDVASLIGGPAAAFGGKLLGPLGMAAQIPLTLRDRELIAREMSMGDVTSPTAGFTGSEMMQPAFTELTDPRMAYPGQGRTR